MAFDAENHVIDPKTGFMIDKETGHKVGLENKPVLVQPVGEWPKWVPLHESQIERRENGPPFSKLWTNTFFNRVNGEVTVLVEDEDEAERAAKDIHAVDVADEKMTLDTIDSHSEPGERGAENMTGAHGAQPENEPLVIE